MRRALRVACCLLAGLVISVAIAWLGAWSEPQPGTYRWAPFVSRQRSGREVPRPLERFAMVRPGVTWELDEVETRARGWVVQREQFAFTARLEPGTASLGGMSPFSLDVYGAGWPLAALEWSDYALRPLVSRRGPPPEETWEFGIEYLGPARTLGSVDGWRRLPVRPSRMGLGLAVNSVVWGTVVGAAWGAAGAFKRRRRRRRGLCVVCGYPVRGAGGGTLGQCPECGERVVSPARSGGSVT